MEPRKKRRSGAELPEEERRRKVLREALAFAVGEEGADRACKNLLGAMGTVDGIFAAPEEALGEIPGVGPKGARLLRLMVESAQLYLEERSWNLRRIYDTPSAVEMFRPKFLGRKTEAVALMLLDTRGRMVFNDIICEGDFSEAPLHLRRILHLCIQYQSDTVYLAHNHPSGLCFPSANDLIATDQLLVALEGIEASLSDHIIFAGDSYYSFLGGGVLTRQRDIMRQAHQEETAEVRRLGQRLRGEREEEREDI